MVELLLPVGVRSMSSWATHQRRVPRSTEPGTDFYCPPGTPVLAPADGMIWGAGNSVTPPTGRWVGVDFTNGMSFRAMHHAELRRASGRVFQGDVIALSGSSGYGSEYFGEPSRNAAFYRNTGGDHTHVTLWPTHEHRFGYRPDGRPYTVDFMEYVGGGSPASGGATDWDDMASKQEIKDAMFEVLIEAKLGPGDRNHWDSLKFLAGLVDAKGNEIIDHSSTIDPQTIKDALVDVLIGYGAGPGNRNHFDSLRFIADLIASGAAVIDYGKLAEAIIAAGGQAPSVDATARAVRDLFASEPLK